MKLGVLFGSFNPLHNGHVAVAKKAMSDAGLDEVWFVIQPSNNYKPELAFLDYPVRKKLLEESLRDIPNMRIFEPQTTDYAHFMPKALKEIKDCEPTLILGADLASSFDSWPDHNEIMALANVYTSPRLDD